MTNITLRVDDEVIRKVRKIAVDKRTTLTKMVREFLGSVAARDEVTKQQALRGLENSFAKLSRNMGTHGWIQEDLHER